MAECQGACSGNKAGAEETETYLLDFTRPYHNLLGIENGNSRKTFYWDGNVIGMEEQNHTPALPETALQTDGNVLTTGNVPTTGNIPTAGMHYYLLDELGSPRRVNGYEEGDKSAYLTYGYDEFGNDLYEDLEEAGIPNPYSRQGEEQPFGYTGYRYDNISHSYFAQAREYQPENGRFNAEDVIKGNGAFPETLNHYGYCLNNPMALVDLDGMEPELPVFEPLVPETEQEKPIEFPVSPFIEEEETSNVGEDLFAPFDPSNLPEGDTSRVHEKGEVTIINISFSGGAIIYASVGVQVVIEQDGDFGVQGVVGFGIKTSIGMGTSISAGRLGVPTIEKSEGWGMEAGISGGTKMILGVSGISAYDEKGYLAGTGEMLSLSKGAQAPFVDAHIGASYALSWEDIESFLIDVSRNMMPSPICIE